MSCEAARVAAAEAAAKCKEAQITRHEAGMVAAQAAAADAQPMSRRAR